MRRLTLKFPRVNTGFLPRRRGSPCDPPYFLFQLIPVHCSLGMTFRPSALPLHWAPWAKLVPHGQHAVYQRNAGYAEMLAAMSKLRDKALIK